MLKCAAVSNVIHTNVFSLRFILYVDEYRDVVCCVHIRASEFLWKILILFFLVLQF